MNVWKLPTFESKLARAISRRSGISMPTCLGAYVKERAFALGPEFRQ